MYRLYSMAGGLLNLVSIGNQNVVITGNPSKTFFKIVYSRYTNFGLQKFRLEPVGGGQLDVAHPRTFKFKARRYGDLITGMYFAIDLPNIWSPIAGPFAANAAPAPPATAYRYAPYEFRWVRNVGTALIKWVRYTIGGQLVQQISGEHMEAIAQRRLSSAKKALRAKMIGGTPELYDPSAWLGQNAYPSVAQPAHATNGNPPEAAPSIRGRTLYVPLSAWGTAESGPPFPVASLSDAELQIEIECRPIIELIQVRDVKVAMVASAASPQPQPSAVWGEYRALDPNAPHEQLYRFLQPPPALSAPVDLATQGVLLPGCPPNAAQPLSSCAKAYWAEYDQKPQKWDSSPRVLATYAFLTDPEVRQFVTTPQRYAIRSCREYETTGITGAQRVPLPTSGLAACWMWRFRRSDAYSRNEWSNYTNWALQEQDPTKLSPGPLAPSAAPASLPGWNWSSAFGPASTRTGIWCTPGVAPGLELQPDILKSWGVILDGKEREAVRPRGVVDFVVPYMRAKGQLPKGLYLYSFGVGSSKNLAQPLGAANLDSFKTIEFQIDVVEPPLDPEALTLTVCEASPDPRFPLDGVPVGVNKPDWRIHLYEYDLLVMEERYNLVTFEAGTASLLYVR